MPKTTYLDRNTARKIDSIAISDYKIPGLILMENAGISCINYLLSLKLSGKIIICCGKGNNAGDGFVIARHLDNLNFDVKVLLLSNPTEFKGDAKTNYEIVRKSNIETVTLNNNLENIASEIQKADWIIDAIFGTGLYGEVLSPYNEIINLINSAKAKVFAVDIPSGLDCDTGEPLGVAIIANHTMTFIGYKKGFASDGAQKYLGNITIGDIGLPKALKKKYNCS